MTDRDEKTRLEKLLLLEKACKAVSEDLGKTGEAIRKIYEKHKGRLSAA